MKKKITIGLPRKKKMGISTIFGTIFFLIIVVAVFAVFLFELNKQTDTTIRSMYAYNRMAQHALFALAFNKNITYLVVTSPVNITYIIYPNGSVIQTYIQVHSMIPIKNITENQKWAVIVTNQGTWYNVSNISVPVIN